MPAPASKPKIGRRKMLAGTAALVGATAAVVTTQTRAKKKPLPPEVSALFGDIGPGSTVGECRIAEVHPVQRGAISVVLTHGTKAFQVDVLKRDPKGAMPVGETATLALFIANQGGGSSRTDEAKGRAVRELANALSRREEQGAVAPELLTLRERGERFAGGLDQVR
jgi:hypothetical protein